MSIWTYVVPVVFILAIVFVMMPIMKKKAAAANSIMSVMKDSKVIIFLLAGHLKSINGIEESALLQTNNIFGVDQDGSMTVEFIPSFAFHKTVYTGTSPMAISFEAQTGKSYEIGVVNQEPKDDPTIIDVSPVVSDELIFKSKFYIVTKDITDSSQAKAMRGVF